MELKGGTEMELKGGTEMELKVQGYMLTPGILEALVEWVDKDTTTFDLIH